MDNQAPLQFSNPLHVPKTINSLPLEIVCKIAQYLAINPDVTTMNRTKQGRKNLYRLCFASKALYPGAARTLYEVVDISSIRRLGHFLRTIESQPNKGNDVHKLFVNLRVCFNSKDNQLGSLKLCDLLYRVLNTTKNLQLLSLDLQECPHFMCYRNSSPASFAVNGANGKKLSMNCMSFTTWPLSRSSLSLWGLSNFSVWLPLASQQILPTDTITVGYDNFFERVSDRIWNELNVKDRTFLPSLKDFYFTSSDIPYMHCAFFALPSLERIVSMRDTGAWPMILYPDYDIGIENPHIKEISLRNSALMPSDVHVIHRSFPMLERFEAHNDPQETNRQFSSGGLTAAGSDQQNLSVTLAKMRHLIDLSLVQHFPKAPGLAQINFPMHLGPAGGITGLAGLRNLTDLTISTNLLMCYRGEDSQPLALPLTPSVLPPNLERLRLYTCLSCWDNRIAALSRYPWQQTQPSFAGLSTFKFIEYLAAYVSSGSWLLPRLKEVRLYSEDRWWRSWGVDHRTVVHCEEEKGEIWDAGGFEEKCGISRFDNRGVHFRAYQSDEADCGRGLPLYHH